jgi:DNA-binding NtrC family response regulator
LVQLLHAVPARKQTVPEHQHAEKRSCYRTLGQAFIAANPTRVLLAEDNADMRLMLVSTLRRDGYEVLDFADGAALLGVAMATPPRAGISEVIISDIRMPGQTGLEVLARMRHMGLKTPVILITAFGDSQVHAEAARLGALVFDKPFDLDDLRLALLELRGRH